MKPNKMNDTIEDKLSAIEVNRSDENRKLLELVRE